VADRSGHSGDLAARPTGCSKCRAHGQLGSGVMLIMLAAYWLLRRCHRAVRRDESGRRVGDDKLTPDNPRAVRPRKNASQPGPLLGGLGPLSL
jgi:hypothetical protein